VRRPIPSKPGTCTERNDVDPTGISVKVSAQYPGRSGVLPERATGVERRGEGKPEVSRGHSRSAAHRRAEHGETRVGPLISMNDEEAQARALQSAGADTPSVADAASAGRNPSAGGDGAELSTATAGRTKAEAATQLMEQVVERGNMWKAYERVLRNKGAPGADGMRVQDLKAWLQTHWPTVKAALLVGGYLPREVRAVDIPKPSGGERTLGVPSAVDRLIQQALLQILQPIFEGGFSQSSYGFRPGRNAWQAVQAAREHVRSGRGWVVDIDLAKFFDRVNHDLLMARVARQVKDTRVLGIIRRFLEAGLMREGLVQQRKEGTPQGGPLSPLLSNIMLTDWDRELERRGHAFARYADDCNVYLGSQAAAEQAFETAKRYLESKLKLQINPDKSGVARASQRDFLGYGLIGREKARLKVAAKSIQRLRERVKDVLLTSRGMSVQATIEKLNPLLRGWTSYFRCAQVKEVWQELDGWIRRKLRGRLWRQCKRPYARAKMLIKRGLSEERAWRSATNGRGAWWNAGASHMNHAFPKAVFDHMGLVSLVDTHRHFQSST
jgi:RNA-directed DNA polymerase